MFCSSCGNNLGKVSTYPVTCESCKKVHYKNPVPVVVCLLPAIDQRVASAKRGALLVRRSFGRTAGQYALPGGFIDIADVNWQHAASREVREETGLDVPPEAWKLFELGTADDRNLLVFVCAESFQVSWDGEGPPANKETNALKIAYEPELLAFPTHSAALGRFLSEKG